MRRTIGVLVVLTTPVLVAAGPGDDVREELRALEGTWKAVAFEAGGKPIPREGVPEFTMVIGADGKSTGRVPGEEFRFTITVDPTKSPKTIVNHHESGEQKGKKQYG